MLNPDELITLRCAGDDDNGDASSEAADNDGCDHGDYSADSDADSSDTDAG
jgi:hypothetical protein